MSEEVRKRNSKKKKDNEFDNPSDTKTVKKPQANVKPRKPSKDSHASNATSKPAVFTYMIFITLLLIIGLFLGLILVELHIKQKGLTELFEFSRESSPLHSKDRIYAADKKTDESVSEGEFLMKNDLYTNHKMPPGREDPEPGGSDQAADVVLNDSDPKTISEERLADIEEQIIIQEDISIDQDKLAVPDFTDNKAHSDSKLSGSSKEGVKEKPSASKPEDTSKVNLDSVRPEIKPNTRLIDLYNEVEKLTEEVLAYDPENDMVRQLAPHLEGIIRDMNADKLTGIEESLMHIREILWDLKRRLKETLDKQEKEKTPGSRIPVDEIVPDPIYIAPRGSKDSDGKNDKLIVQEEQAARDTVKSDSVKTIKQTDQDIKTDIPEMLVSLPEAPEAIHIAQLDKSEPGCREKELKPESEEKESLPALHVNELQQKAEEKSKESEPDVSPNESKPHHVAEETKPEPHAKVSKPGHVAKESKPGPHEKESKPDHVAKESKPAPDEKESKPDHVAKESKPGPHEKESKPDHVAKESTPGPHEKESKPDHFAKESKPEPHAEESKPDHVAKESKPEPQADESKPDHVAKESKQEPHEKESKPDHVAKESKQEPHAEESKPDLVTAESKLEPHLKESRLESSSTILEATAKEPKLEPHAKESKPNLSTSEPTSKSNAKPGPVTKESEPVTNVKDSEPDPFIMKSKPELVVKSSASQPGQLFPDPSAKESDSKPKADKSEQSKEKESKPQSYADKSQAVPKAEESQPQLSTNEALPNINPREVKSESAAPEQQTKEQRPDPKDIKSIPESKKDQIEQVEKQPKQDSGLSGIEVTSKVEESIPNVLPPAAKMPTEPDVKRGKREVEGTDNQEKKVLETVQEREQVKTDAKAKETLGLQDPIALKEQKIKKVVPSDQEMQSPRDTKSEYDGTTETTLRHSKEEDKEAVRAEKDYHQDGPTAAQKKQSTNKHEKQSVSFENRKHNAEQETKERMEHVGQTGDGSAKKEAKISSEKTNQNRPKSDLSKDIQDQLNLAESLLKENPVDALKIYTEVLNKRQQLPIALLGAAKSVDRLAEVEKSNKRLEQAISMYLQIITLATTVPDSIPKEILHEAGLACIQRLNFRGWRTKAISVIQNLLLTYFPDDIKLYTELGRSYLIIGNSDAAKDVFLKVLARWPDDGYAQVHYGFILKTIDENFTEGIKYLESGIHSGDEGTADGKFYLHLGDAYQRLGDDDKANQIYDEAVSKGLFLSRYQRSLYNIDRLKSRPVWKLEDTTYENFFRKLEANWKRIKEEGMKILQLDSTQGFQPEVEKLRKTGDWGQFELFARGTKNKGHCALAPFTCSLIDEFPAAITNKRGQVKFSVMQPGTKVHKHTGPTNCRLRAHLGLVTPPGAQLKVVDIIKTWKEGEVFVFDDSFEHEVWHNGDSVRLILIVDVWHPEITEQEKATMTAI